MSEENITPEQAENNIDLDAALEKELEAVEDTTVASAEKKEETAPDETAADTPVDTSEEVAKDADPFARISKKKVAKPRSMNDIMKGKVKKGRRLSPKIFLIGCAGFFLLFLWLAYGGLYYAVTSAWVLESIGLEIDSVKNILLIFAILLFGIIFFIGFYFLVLNVYRLVTAKGKKIWYIFGLIWGLVILWATIVFGTISISKIRSLTGEQKLQTNLLVAPWVVTRSGPVLGDSGIPLIAPLKMQYQLNKTQIDRYILPAIGNKPIVQYTVDCGNEQKLSAGQAVYLWQNNGFFNGHCLYMNKGEYELKLEVTYQEGNDQQTRIFDVVPFKIQAEIELEALDDTSSLNDTLTEYIIGIAPVTVRFRGQKLFTDLGLSDDRIEWDLDEDNNVDLVDNATFEHLYSSSKLHEVAYRLPDYPGFSDTWFVYDLRVVESELASCDIDIEETDPQRRKYTFTPKFDELVQAQAYHYTIYDMTNDSIVEKFKTSSDDATFSFPRGGEYEISASYFTPQGEKGSCITAPLDIWFEGNQVAFDLKWKQTDDVPFTRIGENTPVILDTASRSINVTTVPAILEFTITEIAPDPDADLTVFYEGRQVFPEALWVYEVALSSLWEKDLEFKLQTKQWNTSQQDYTIDISRASVKAMMKVTPDLVGEDPFDVILDASISPLYDENDEIVYFSWDFGDGESRENVSQGKISHTYRFDTDKNTGEYYPSVKVKTKLGYEDSYRLTTPITVKRQQKEVKIRVDSHPTQQVRLWELVEYVVETDGLVEHIDRDFGNQKAIGCDDRSCASASMRYFTPGEYIIKTEVQYANDSPVVGRVKIKVYE